MIDKKWLQKAAADYIEQSNENRIGHTDGLSGDIDSFRIFDDPIFAIGSAADDLFTRLKQPAVIGEHVLLPKDWLPSARTVVSYFLPFSEAVKRGNSRDMSWPSAEWLYARIEGQQLLDKLGLFMQKLLTDAGFDSVIPSLDDRFWSNSGDPELKGAFTSNWSERHAAYICGLGTFGLSKGLITAKGIAGRFGSIVTALSLPPDQRDYREIYEYCNLCGQCINNCPVQAITIEDGKNHVPCKMFLNKTKERCDPRYGCGKCQVHVPCESGIPI